MKKVFLLACILSLGLFRMVDAGTFSIEDTKFRATVQTTTTGALFIVENKNNGRIVYNPWVSLYDYDQQKSKRVWVLDEFQREFTKRGEQDILWLGGLVSNKTYYFYPYGIIPNPVLAFTTEGAGSQSGSYTIKNSGTQNGNIIVTYTVPFTDRRDFSIIVIPRESLGTYKVLNLDNYVSYITKPISNTATITITNTDSKKEYLLILLPVGGSGGGVPIAIGLARPGTQYSPTSITADGPFFNPNGDAIDVSGKIDSSVHSYPEDFDVLLEYSRYGKFSTDLTKVPQGVKKEFASTEPGGSTRGVNPDGTYFWRLTALDPATYYFRQTFYTLDGKVIGTPIVGDFLGKVGYTPPTYSDEEKDFEKRSYRLLAPLPGLSVLLDPDLCRDQQIKNPQKGYVCDINDFLNFAFGFLIGFSAVVLVLRLMFEGYQYIVTDVPFLKARAKSSIITASLGLLLALSAYLILNTINPKLVSNNFNLSSVALSVTPGEDGLGVTTPKNKKLTLTTKSGKTVSVTACNNNDMVKVSAFGTTFKIYKGLLPSVQRIDAKWRQMDPSYKIPMTVKDKSDMGGFVCRNIAGKKTLSYHAYGLAIDINPSTNPYSSTLKTDMPSAFIKLWTDEGWGWGGKWEGNKDAMHFSKGRNEGGNMIVD